MPGNEKTTETQTPKRRVRTGCLTCRRRRRKCDEGKPSCANCQNKRIQCRYGVNLTFLPDNAASLNPEDIRSFPSPAPYSEIKFVASSEDGRLERDEPTEDHESINDRGDSSATAESGNESQVVFPRNSNSPEGVYEIPPTSPQAFDYDYCDGQHNFSPTDTPYYGPALSPRHLPPRSITRTTRVNEVNQGHESTTPYDSSCKRGFEGLGLDSARIPAIPSSCQPDLTYNGEFDSSPRDIPSSSIGEKELQLLKYYRYEVAPWLDMCDLYQRFGLDLVIVGKTHRPLNDALFAISCCRQELLQGIPITETSDSILYARSSEALLTLDLQAHDQNVTYTYTVLKFIDFMSAEPQDWKLQLQNVSPLLDSLRFQAFTEGLMEAAFWNYVRLDISSVLVEGGNITLPIHEWFPRGIELEESQQMFILRRSMDDWARYSMLLCARAIDVRSERNIPTTTGTETQLADYASRWIEIWNQTQAWYRDRPIELISVLDAPADSLEDCSANVFPTAIFSTGCAILANQLHHTTALLLLQCKPRTLRLPNGKTSPVWHAQKICGIAASNDLSRTWDFTLLASLLMAARVMTHSSQHAVIIDTIEQVRRLTGWRVDSEIDRLRVFWNLGGQNVS